MNSDLRWAKLVGAGALVALPFALVVLLPDGTTRALVSEDSIVEWVGALAWLAASGLFAAKLVAQRRFGTRAIVGTIALVGLALMCFVAAGEEISWGQRLLGYDTPEAIARDNLQSEMNLHNHELLDVRTSIDGNEKTGLARWLTFNRLSSLIWLGYLVACPLAVRFSSLARSLATRWALPIPPLPVAVAAAANYAAFYVLLSSLTTPDTTQKTLNVAANEIKESAIAVLFAATAYAHVRWSRPGGHERNSDAPSNPVPLDVQPA